jgi:hypothetical protein
MDDRIANPPLTRMIHGMNQPTPEKIMQTGLGFWAAKTLLSAVEMEVFTELAKRPEDLALAGVGGQGLPSGSRRLMVWPPCIAGSHCRARARQMSTENFVHDQND